MTNVVDGRAAPRYAGDARLGAAPPLIAPSAIVVKGASDADHGQARAPNSETDLIHRQKGVVDATPVSLRGTAGTTPPSAGSSGRRWWGGGRTAARPAGARADKSLPLTRHVAPVPGSAGDAVLADQAEA